MKKSKLVNLTIAVSFLASVIYLGEVFWRFLWVPLQESWLVAMSWLSSFPSNLSSWPSIGVLYLLLIPFLYKKWSAAPSGTPMRVSVMRDGGRVLALGTMVGLFHALIEWIPDSATIPFPNLPIRMRPFLQVIDGMWFVAFVCSFFSEYDYLPVRVRQSIGRFEKVFLLLYPGEAGYIVSYSALAVNVPFFMDNFQLFFLPVLIAMWLGFTSGWWIDLMRVYHSAAVKVARYVRRRLKGLSPADSNQGL